MSGHWWCPLAFGETFRMCASLLFVRGVILSLVAQFTLHSVSVWAWSCMFDGLPCFWRAILEAFVADISVASAWYKGCVGVFLLASSDTNGRGK